MPPMDAGSIPAGSTLDCRRRVSAKSADRVASFITAARAGAPPPAPPIAYPVVC